MGIENGPSFPIENQESAVEEEMSDLDILGALSEQVAELRQEIAVMESRGDDTSDKRELLEELESSLEVFQDYEEEEDFEEVASESDPLKFSVGGQLFEIKSLLRREGEGTLSSEQVDLLGRFRKRYGDDLSEEVIRSQQED